jgi:hypothetical protein
MYFEISVAVFAKWLPGFQRRVLVGISVSDNTTRQEKYYE